MRGALTLNIATLVRFRDSQDVFRRGILTLVLVALVVGGVAFVVDFVASLITPPEAEIAQFQENFEQMLRFMPLDARQAFEDQFMGNFQAGAEIGLAIEALPTPLPRVAGKFFEALGGWVHRPLAMLGGFLGYSIWVMLTAKLLGGTGRLQEFLGTAALSAVPYLLLVLEKVPCLGSLLGLAAWIWSIFIWVAATAVAHSWVAPVTEDGSVVQSYQVSWGKATLAVVLPALALAVLIAIGAIILIAFIAITAS
jgi:hypothetical protein